MKKSKVFLLLLLCLFSNNIYAQKSEIVSIEDVLGDKSSMTSLSVGIGGGFSSANQTLYGISLTGALPSGWGASVSFGQYNIDASSRVGLSSRGVLWNQPTPSDRLQSYSLRVLKKFTIQSQAHVRFSIEIGPSLIHLRTAFRDDNYAGTWLGIGKDIVHKKIVDNSLGLSMRAKIEMPFARAFGAEFALVSNINKHQNYIGVEVLVLTGWVRNKLGR